MFERKGGRFIGFKKFLLFSVSMSMCFSIKITIKFVKENICDTNVLFKVFYYKAKKTIYCVIFFLTYNIR